MIERFQIEDLVVQDSSGVVFRAIDSETLLPVAVRRFFPFGPTGGGFDGAEQATYGESIRILSAVSHPALRSIVCGGCDPVDGMPYFATEWIEGHALQTVLQERPLSQSEATFLLGEALGVCQLLSNSIGREGVWVELEPHSIIIGAQESQRPVSFWVCPLKWMGKGDGALGLEAFIYLTNAMMGRSGNQIHDLPATGLGGWLKWLHGTARTATLQEARAMLASTTGMSSPQPTKRVVRQTTRPIVPGKKKSSSKAPIWIFASTVIMGTALGGWFLVHRNAIQLAKANEIRIPEVKSVSPPESAASAVALAKSEEPEIAPEAAREISVEEVNRRAIERTAALGKITAAATPTPKAPPKAKAKPVVVKKTPVTKGGVFSPSDHDTLVAQEGQEVIVEGKFDSVASSKSGATQYVVFVGSLESSDFRGAIRDAVGELSQTALQPLVGKNIRLAGKIRLENVGSRKRPVIDIEKREEIQVLDK